MMRGAYFNFARGIFTSTTFIHVDFAMIALSVTMNPHHIIHHPAVRATKSNLGFVLHLY
jgi:precorrin-3B methylase